MIARLRGRVVASQPQCVVDVGGVGFELLIPEKDREQLRPEDADAQFYTYLYVREDRLNLFGFLHREDRDLFLRLIDVSGVGPKLALGVLSLYPCEQIVSAIRRQDVAFLQKMPGLGRKTAERVCMELAEKLDDIAPREAPAAPASGSRLRDEVILALASLGMTRHAAEATLTRMNWTPDETTSVEEVVREALRYAGSP